MTDQRIVYPDSLFHAIAWRDCLAWALESPDVRAQFTMETGVRFPEPAMNAIDHMVDQATKHQTFVIEQFVEWFNANIWGADPYVSGEPVFPEEPEVSSGSTP